MKIFTKAVLLASAFATSLAMAEQRALLIGVGKYEIEGIDLPGIDLDLDRMQDTLNVMGFEDSQIRRLLDEQATADNVREQFDTWLMDGVNADDRVVVYFSGHGSFIPDTNNDEPDGVDEVLVTHDVRFVTKNGRRSLTGVVTDDEINAMIQLTGSNNVLFIVDACHSGTMTRDIFMKRKSLTGEAVYEKSFVYDGMPEGEDATMTRDLSLKSVDDSKFVGISAAGDGEKAIGTSQGGVFTIGFSNAIVESAKSGNPVTIEEARDAAERFIRQKIDPRRVHTPQVTGSTELANGKLQIVPIENGNGPIWQRLEGMAAQGEFLDVRTDLQEYIVDDAIQLELDVPKSGYLNLITVDSKDTATVLYPNILDPDNQVDAGKFRFPTDDAEFEFAAARPLGPTLLVAFVTEEPVNFRELGFEGRTDDGSYSDDAAFTEVTYAATRAIKLRRKQKDEDSGGSTVTAVASAAVVAATQVAATVAEEAVSTAADQVGDAIDTAGTAADAAVIAATTVAAVMADPDDDADAEAVAEEAPAGDEVGATESEVGTQVAEADTTTADDEEADVVADVEPIVESEPEPLVFAAAIEIMVKDRP